MPSLWSVGGDWVGSPALSLPEDSPGMASLALRWSKVGFAPKEGIPLTLRLCVCARGYEEPSTGLCPPCVEERQHAEYVRADHSFADRRRQNWRERKRRQRERERHRPDEPLPEDVDLLELQDEVIMGLEKLRARVKHDPVADAMVDEQIEVVKRLTWGPE